MKIILTGPKGSGKSTIGKMAAARLNVAYIEIDDVIEDLFAEKTGTRKICSVICNEMGESVFRDYEKKAIEKIANDDWGIICTGGSTMIYPELRNILRQNSVIVLLYASLDTLLKRFLNSKPETYLLGKSTIELFAHRAGLVIEETRAHADIVIDNTNLTQEEVADMLIDNLEKEFIIRMNRPNTFGEIIRLTTFGESHGPVIGAVLDGMKPGMPFDKEFIQSELERRRPGQSKVTSPRNEMDRLKIVSGVFEGKTTGTPICMMIENRDPDSTKYDVIKDIIRPGCADFTFMKKYSIRDHRGGGRASGRETAARVMGGAIGKKILQERGVSIVAHTIQVGTVVAEKISYDAIEKNSVRCGDEAAAEKMEQLIIDVKSKGDSIGGMVQLEIKGVPAGLGDPVFGKLSARLGAALLSIGSIKGIEFGAGFSVSHMLGSENNDPMAGGQFASNNAGGMLGGISTGQDIVIRLAVKPTPSIKKVQKTGTFQGEDVEVSVKGRHDPCLAPRIIPVVENMAALVILDAWEMQDRLHPNWLPDR